MYDQPLETESESFCPDWDSPFALDNVWKIASGPFIDIGKRRIGGQIWPWHDNSRRGIYQTQKMYYIEAQPKYNDKNHGKDKYKDQENDKDRLEMI